MLFSHEHPTVIIFCTWLTAIHSQSPTVQELWAIFHWFTTDSITAVLVSMKLKCPHTIATAHCPATGVWFLTSDNWSGIRNAVSEFMIMVYPSVQQKFFWSATIQEHIIYGDRNWFQANQLRILISINSHLALFKSDHFIWMDSIQMSFWFKGDFSNLSKITTATHNVNLGWQAEISPTAMPIVQKIGLASYTGYANGINRMEFNALDLETFKSTVVQWLWS